MMSQALLDGRGTREAEVADAEEDRLELHHSRARE
jgi:hypothetical protein